MNTQPKFDTKLSCSRTLLPLALTLALSACGGGSSGGGNSLTVSGNINTADYPLAAAPGFSQKLASWLGFKPAYAQEIRSVDTLVAIPSDGGNIDIGVYDNIKTASISADGGFDLTLTKEYDWVLLLVNSQALTPDQKVVAYVTVPASVAVAEDGSLIDLPFSSATGSEIDLGKISASTQDSRAARTENDAVDIEAHLSLTLDELKKYAKSDGAYRHFANVYRNYSARSGEFFFPTVEWTWQGRNVAEIGTAYSDPAEFGSVQEAASIEANTQAIAFDEICDSSVSFGLFPPKEITINGVSYGPSAGFMNENMTQGNYGGEPYCYGDSSNFSQRTDGKYSALFMYYPLLQQSDGFWRLNKGDQQIALFDFSLATPYDEGSHPLVFIPSIRVNRDASDINLVTSIDIQWKQYDSASGSYIDVKDDVVTDKLVGRAFITMNDYSADAQDQDVSFGLYDYTGLLSGNIPVDGDYQWSFGFEASNPAEGRAHVSEISVGYEQGGIAYRFIWGTPDADSAT